MLPKFAEGVIGLLEEEWPTFTPAYRDFILDQIGNASVLLMKYVNKKIAEDLHPNGEE